MVFKMQMQIFTCVSEWLLSYYVFCKIDCWYELGLISFVDNILFFMVCLCWSLFNYWF